MKKVIAFLLLLINVTVVHAALTEEQQALITNAEAYLAKGSYIQYDEPTLTYLHKNYVVRDQFIFAPEDATAAYNQYTVCDNFIFTLFYNTFVDANGKNYIINSKDVKYAQSQTAWRPESYYYLGYSYLSITNSSSPYYNPDIVVLSFNNPTSDVTTIDSNSESRVYNEAKATEFKTNVLNVLQPGDIIVYSRRADSDPDNNIYQRTNTAAGHVIVYGGDGVIYHSTYTTGGTYNFGDKKDYWEASGTIYKTELEKYFEKDRRGGLAHPRVNNIAIIRPLNEITANNYQISDNSRARLNYPKLDINKSVKDSRYDTVSIGDNLTYTIKLTNNSDNNYTDIIVSDVIPENTTYVSSTLNGTVTNNKINWSVSVPKSESKTISFTVKVNDDETLNGKYIVSDKTVVGGIKINKINTLIGNTFNADEITSLKSKITNLKDNNYTTTQEFINKAYDNEKIDIKDIDTMISKYFDTKDVDITGVVASPISSDYFNGTHDTGIQKTYDLKKTLTVKDMYINGLYGGVYTIEEDSSEYNELVRMRYLKMTDLTIGDVIIINDADVKKMYLVSEKDNKNILLTVEDNVVKEVTGTTATRVLDSLLGQDNFIVLRPSLALEKVKVEPTETPTIEVPKETPAETTTTTDLGETIDNPKTGVITGLSIVLVLTIITIVLINQKRKFKSKINL